MRVQLITHSYLPERTPPQRRWTAFVEAFRRDGWEVDVIVPQADPGHTPGGAEGIRASSVTDRGPAGERLYRTVGLSALAGTRDGRFAVHVLHALAAVPRGLAAPRPDIVVITVPALPTVVSGWVVSRWRRVPLVVEMRDAWPDLARESGVKAGLLSSAMERLVSGVQRSADAVVTVTEGFAETLSARGVRPVEVIGNGVELSRVPAVPHRDREPGTLNVLYLGNHGESQGLETVIRAAALARRSPARIRVRLVGSGTRRQQLEELNRELGSPVEMLDPVHGAGLSEQYAWADTCLVCLRPDWPSFAWTIPSKTYEILAVGRHVTGVVTGEAARLLSATGSADLVEADPAGLVALWERLAADPEATRTGDTGRQWVARHADLPRLGQRFVGLARRLAGPAADRGSARIPGRAAQLMANLSLTATTVAEHLRDDPALLALQVSRRLPTGLRTRAAAVVGRLDWGPLQVAGAIGLAAAGRTGELRERALAALEDRAPDRRLVHYADILLSAGDREAAGHLLDRVRPGIPDLAAARARQAWDAGRMTEAVEELSGAGREGRQRRQLASELAAFAGARPQLGAVGDYRPSPGRVLHVLTNSLPHTPSGYAQRSHAILTALRDDGWDVSAVTRLGWPVQTGVLHAAAVDTVDGIEYRRLLPRRLAEGFDARMQQHAELLLNTVRALRPAVLHTTSHWTNAMVVQAVADAVGIPWVYEVRGQLADTWASTRGIEARESERYRLFTERDAEAARSADAVVTLGPSMRANLSAHGVDPASIELCPNAVGGVFLEEPGDRTAARRALGLDPHLDYVGTISSIVPYEGLDTLVRAVASLAPTRPGLRLLMAGDGTALPGLLDLAADLGITDRLIVPGRVDRAMAPTYHQALDIFVVPRRDTSVTRSVTPMKSVEASASGRPVVASDLPALAELVEHGVTGLLVTPEDPVALAGTLGELLQDPDRAARMGAAGRAWALRERTWVANAEKYGGLYRALAGAAGVPVGAPGGTRPPV
ncbi:glycosyltransferase family 4 protein [Citricoccus sp. CH26A]|uniref:glycosyltransferase family 4 protein n=1 Tax=Citricoccus TaxID=169133 RepID=UPI0002FCCC76|nr:glycosyltransferase family 4 protein [Citricoccus sp. CH26A]